MMPNRIQKLLNCKKSFFHYNYYLRGARREKWLFLESLSTHTVGLYALVIVSQKSQAFTWCCVVVWYLDKMLCDVHDYTCGRHDFPLGEVTQLGSEVTSCVMNYLLRNESWNAKIFFFINSNWFVQGLRKEGGKCSKFSNTLETFIHDKWIYSLQYPHFFGQFFFM